ncbi:MAG: hypothetical protein ACI92W_001812, partial [Paraglaciecola sp.]
MLKKFTLVAATMFFAFSCDFYDLDINVDPNNPIVTTADLLLPSIQYDWAGDYQFMHNVSAGIMGHTSNSDGLGFTQNSFDGIWRSVYLNEVADLDEYIKSAGVTDANDVLLTPAALAVGQVLKAHIFTTMVDLFGDVPFSEASLGNDDGNVNPAFDAQADIYTACFELVDQAIANLDVAVLEPEGDLIYRGDIDSWKAAAYSLKLKMLIQVRGATGFSYGSGVDAEIRDLIDNNSGEMISSNADNFGFRYNTNVDQGQRHPWMGAVYGGDNAFSYISHQLMYEMLINGDPRIAYYFNRQTTAILDQEDPTDQNTTPCSQNSACIYGYMVLNENVMTELQGAGVITDVTSNGDRGYIASFFGRDKGDPSGVPLDGALRTAPGVYPMGGQFDDGVSKINSSDGLGLGDGSTFFITAPMVSLYKMEAYLQIYNDEAAARTELANFLDLSFDLVESASTAIAGTDATAMTAAAISAATAHDHVVDPADYTIAALARYDAAGDKMNVVFKEAWYSMWGAGLELYNSHRRSDYPRMKAEQSGSRGIADIQYPTFRATGGTSGQ